LSEILVLCSVGVAIGLVRDEVQAQISLLPCLQRPVTYRIRNTGARVLIVIRAYAGKTKRPLITRKRIETGGILCHSALKVRQERDDFTTDPLKDKIPIQKIKIEKYDSAPSDVGPMGA
jgi:hypothetical protein